MSCIICKHFLPVAHDGWQGEPGETYSRYDLRNHIHETEHHAFGLCTLFPQHQKVLTNHFCGQYTKFNIDQDHKRRHRDRNFIWGDWRQREDEAMRNENVELKRQLKIARERSRARLQRLQQREDKNGQQRDSSDPDPASGSG
jgi:hypothetical protein